MRRLSPVFFLPNNFPESHFHRKTSVFMTSSVNVDSIICSCKFYFGVFFIHIYKFNNEVFFFCAAEGFSSFTHLAIFGTDLRSNIKSESAFCAVNKL